MMSFRVILTLFGFLEGPCSVTMTFPRYPIFINLLMPIVAELTICTIQVKFIHNTTVQITMSLCLLHQFPLCVWRAKRKVEMDAKNKYP